MAATALPMAPFVAFERLLKYVPNLVLYAVSDSASCPPAKAPEFVTISTPATGEPNRVMITLIAMVAVTMQLLDTTIANTGNGGGSNAPAAFPNGRRPQDDVITTLLTVINNGSLLSDNVPGNDVPFRSIFPFYAKPHQPLPAGSTDDTKN